MRVFYLKHMQNQPLKFKNHNFQVRNKHHTKKPKQVFLPFLNQLKN
jgi:hypothetical protein